MRTLDIDDRDSRKGRRGTRRWVGKRWGKESPRVERRSWGHTQPQSIKPHLLLPGLMGFLRPVEFYNQRPLTTPSIVQLGSWRPAQIGQELPMVISRSGANQGGSPPAALLPLL